LQVSEYLEEIQIQNVAGHKKPVFFFVLWFALETLPAFVPESVSNIVYNAIYFLSEDLSTIALALACYFALSYTSIVLKGLTLSAVIISTLFFITNLMIEHTAIPQSTTTGIVGFVGFLIIGLFLIRFLFKVSGGSYLKPKHDRIYLIVNKPHSMLGMLGLFYSGMGGGFSAYVNGDCYWFSKDAGSLVKTFDKSWYKGRYLIDCGPVTGDKINDLEAMIGQKWSIFNNCFTVFSRWRRRWA